MNNRFLGITGIVVCLFLAPSISKADLIMSGDVETNIWFDYGAAGPFCVVGNTSGNALLEVNGGSVFSTYGTIMGWSGVSNDSILVTGAGSVFNSGGLSLNGPRQQLTVAAGGAVYSSGMAVQEEASSVLVTDPGSIINLNGHGDGIGLGGSNINFTVQNGAQVFSTWEFGVSGPSCTVLLTDGGTTCSCLDFELGTNCSLIVSNGAHLACSQYDLALDNGTVVITGTGTRVDLASQLYTQNANNQLTIAGGSVLNCGLVRLGGATNSVLVTDTGSSLACSGDIELGGGSPGGISLTIRNGASVAAVSDVGIGNGLGAYNVVEVVGAGSQLSCPAGTIYVGDGAGFSPDNFWYHPDSTANSLVVACDGLVEASNIVVAAGSGPGPDNSLSFASGTIRTKSATIANWSWFTIGDGVNRATYEMEGGTNTFSFSNNSFGKGLVISQNSVLTGCGTVVGNVTNYGTISITGGCDMQFYGTVVNYGQILALNGTPIFHGAFINHGSVLMNTARITGLSLTGSDVTVQFNTVAGYLHDVQATSDLASGTWMALSNGLVGSGGPMSLVDSGGGTNTQRFYQILLHY